MLLLVGARQRLQRARRLAAHVVEDDHHGEVDGIGGRLGRASGGRGGPAAARRGAAATPGSSSVRRQATAVASTGSSGWS